MLSPFTVSNDKDRGYAATATLSGTRLNTSLRDTAAAVSVITPELLQDLAVNDVNSLATFMVNTERDPNVPNAAFNGESNNASSVRVRGLVTTASQANFFAIPWVIDAYNIERITQTRGPNSLLFGVGSPAGSLNATTKKASLRQQNVATRVGISTDSYDSRRSEIDVHAPLIPNRLALRIIGLDEQRLGFLDYERRDNRRLFATATLKVADYSSYHADLRVFGEWAVANRDLADVATPNDNLTAWMAASRPTVAGTASAGNAANLPAGTVRAASAARLVAIDGSPTAVPVLNWINTARSVSSNAAASLRFGPDAPVPLDVNYRGPAVGSNFAGRSIQVSFEQTFFQSLAMEIASSRTNFDLYWVRNSGFTLTADVNQNLPNGLPNPNVGHVYTEDTFRLQAENRTTGEDRATLAYRFNGNQYSPWLGSWVFSGLVNQSFNTQGLDDQYEYNTTPLPGFSVAAANNQNRIVRRTYLFNGAKVWLPTADFGHNLPEIAAPGVTPALRNTRAVNDYSGIRGWTFGTQAKVLRDRLVFTYGHRHDAVKRYSASPLAGADGFLNHWTTYDRPAAGQLQAETQTFGTVAHLRNWLSVFYNKSESIDLAQPRRDIFGVPLPGPSGTSKDYGLKFSLSENRLNATLTRFDTRSLNQQNSPGGGIPAAIGLIEDATGRSINILNRGEVPPDTQDLVAHGYELEFTYNPTENWRITANASKLDNIASNVNLRFKRFLEERVYPLASTYGTVVTSDGRTVASIISGFRNQVATFATAREGVPANELREWSSNLISSYTVTRGRLRGLGFGGNVQYRGPNVLGNRVDAAGLTIPSARIWGDSDFTLGAHLRYQCKLANRIRCTFQLNVLNLLDAAMLVRKAVDPTTGQTVGWGYRQPRAFRLSSTMDF